MVIKLIKIKIIFFYLIVISLLYILFEFSFRYFFNKFFSFTVELEHISNLENITDYNYYYSNKIDFLDDNIGFKKNYKLKQISKNKIKKISITGDSVTLGVGTDKKFSQFLDNYILNEYIILNLSTENHGIYQIAHSFNENNLLVNAEINLITPIAHDLIRPGKTYMSSLLRPIYRLKDDKLKIIKNFDYDTYIKSYILSKKYFYNSFWNLKFIFDNRKYYFASFYGNFYSKIFYNSFKKLIDNKNGNEIVVLILPTSFSFYHKNFLVNLFKKTYNNNFSNEIKFIDIEACVIKNLKADGIDYISATNLIHPSSSVHKAYGYCIHEKLKSLNIL